MWPDPLSILEKYYPPGSDSYRILLQHSMSVRNLALRISSQNKHLQADEEILSVAAMLHDIGIFLTNAPEIGCYGDYPYICHGFLGRELLEKEGFPKLALFCERHTGTGITLDEILQNQLPLPHRNMIPDTIEEKIICYADKFFSKSGENITKPKKLKQIYAQLIRYGEHKAREFDQFIGLFGIHYIYNW